MEHSLLRLVYPQWQGGLRETFGLSCAIAPQKVLLVGLHSDEAKHYVTRQREFGLKSLSPEEAEDSAKVMRWLEEIGAKSCSFILI